MRSVGQVWSSKCLTFSQILVVFSVSNLQPLSHAVLSEKRGVGGANKVPGAENVPNSGPRGGGGASEWGEGGLHFKKDLPHPFICICVHIDIYRPKPFLRGSGGAFPPPPPV